MSRGDLTKTSLIVPLACRKALVTSNESTVQLYEAASENNSLITTLVTVGESFFILQISSKPLATNLALNCSLFSPLVVTTHLEDTWLCPVSFVS